MKKEKKRNKTERETAMNNHFVQMPAVLGWFRTLLGIAGSPFWQ